MLLSEKEIAEVVSVLAEPKKIVITTHRSPDGDAIGSSMALYYYLKAKGHEPRVVVPNSYPSFIHWLPEDETVVEFDRAEAQATQLVNEAEIIFCLDYNALHRMERLGKVVADTNCLRILIDHHQEPEKIARYMYSDVTASSTAELVHRFISDLGDKSMINLDMAYALYMGMITDTGSFRFSSTSPTTMRVAADLLELGVDLEKVYGNIFDTNPVNRLRFWGFCMSERLTVLPEYETAYIAVSLEDKKRFGFKKGDDEGLVNYGLSVEGVRFAALITEMEDLIKFSLRSKGDFSVNAIARDHFHGGGHINAAGGYLHGTLDEAIQQFEALLPRYHSNSVS